MSTAVEPPVSKRIESWHLYGRSVVGLMYTCEHCQLTTTNAHRDHWWWRYVHVAGQRGAHTQTLCGLCKPEESVIRKLRLTTAPSICPKCANAALRSARHYVSCLLCGWDVFLMPAKED